MVAVCSVGCTRGDMTAQLRCWVHVDAGLAARRLLHVWRPGNRRHRGVAVVGSVLGGRGGGCSQGVDRRGAHLPMPLLPLCWLAGLDLAGGSHFHHDHMCVNFTVFLHVLCRLLILRLV